MYAQHKNLAYWSIQFFFSRIYGGAGFGSENWLAKLFFSIEAVAWHSSGKRITSILNLHFGTLANANTTNTSCTIANFPKESMRSL